MDLHTKVYYPNNNNTQSITLTYGTLTPVDYNIVLPCIAVHRPTKYEVKILSRLPRFQNYIDILMAKEEVSLR